MKTKFELLSNIDLQYYCKILKIPLVNILYKDLFKNIIPKEGCYIINLQSSDIGNGSHWTALYLTKNVAVYYDSFGLSLPRPILRFVRRLNINIKIIYSVDQIQEINSIFCGWFCLYFLWFFSVLHKKCTNCGYLMNKHNSCFSLKNKHLNDRILRQLIKTIT